MTCAQVVLGDVTRYECVQIAIEETESGVTKLSSP